MRRFLIFLVILPLPFAAAMPASSTEGRAAAGNPWSVQASFHTAWSGMDEINGNYDGITTDLEKNYDFQAVSLKNQNVFLGAQTDLLYQFADPYLVGAGFSFQLDIPGEARFRKKTREEFYSVSYSLASYLFQLKLGQELIRRSSFFIRGFLELDAGIGRIAIVEKVEGSDFGSSRENTSNLSSFGWGMALNLDFLYRLSIRSGIFFGLHGGFLSFTNWKGTDSFGNSGKLVKTRISGTSREVFSFLKDGQNLPGDQQDVSLLLSEIRLDIGFWQSL